MIRPPNATSRAGYSGLSIALHWLAVILIVALFVTNEAEEGSAGYVFHVSGGAIAGTVLLWRVWRLVRHGMAERPSQGAIFDLVSPGRPVGLHRGDRRGRCLRLLGAVVGRKAPRLVRLGRDPIADGRKSAGPRVCERVARSVGDAVPSALDRAPARRSQACIP